MAIPKIIHYCWFGRGAYPDVMKKCIDSWKRFCPGWQLMLWDESSFDVSAVPWTQQAYAAKKYAFVADYVRLKVLREYGGVYLDIDQELLRPLDGFLEHRAFLGFMREDSVSMGILGAEPFHPTICRLLHYYDGRRFLTEGGQDLLPITDWVTSSLTEDGLKPDDTLQTLKNGVVVYPRAYFCPTYCTQPKSLFTDETVSVHHWAMTWRTGAEKRKIAWFKFKRRKPVAFLDKGRRKLKG